MIPSTPPSDRNFGKRFRWFLPEAFACSSRGAAFCRLVYGFFFCSWQQFAGTRKKGFEECFFCPSFVFSRTEIKNNKPTDVVFRFLLFSGSSYTSICSESVVFFFSTVLNPSNHGVTTFSFYMGALCYACLFFCIELFSRLRCVRPRQREAPGFGVASRPATQNLAACVEFLRVRSGSLAPSEKTCGSSGRPVD